MGILNSLASAGASHIDDALRAADSAPVIRGLLGYNPGPGIYSRLERAIEDMPTNVRVQELPGLLKRYKEGVPGWELKAVDLDSTIDGRDLVPRDELLQAVRERSPVYTHREIVYQDGAATQPPAEGQSLAGWLQGQSSPLGSDVRHGDPIYGDYSQGGSNYTELLLTQPGADGNLFGSHWTRRIQGFPAVAHARFDTHGDALRINELQSDLGIHNRKAREAGPVPDYRGGDGPFDFMPPQDDAAMAAIANQHRELPFPLEDAWADLLIKRIALAAARGGHRAIEIASPLAISRGAAGKVGTGMNIDKLDHLMHKMVAPRLERIGRKMGGLIDDSPPPSVSPANAHEEIRKLLQQADKEMQQAGWRARGYDPNPVPGKDGDLWLDGPSLGRTGWRNFAAMQYAANPEVYDRSIDALGGRVFTPDVWGGYGPPNMRAVGEVMYEDLMRHEGLSPQSAGTLVGEAMRLADQSSQARALYLRSAGSTPAAEVPPISRRYLMSDEMRRRLIEGGIGAAVLAPLLMQAGDE